MYPEIDLIKLKIKESISRQGIDSDLISINKKLSRLRNQSKYQDRFLKVLLICLFVLGCLNVLAYKNPSTVKGTIVFPQDDTNILPSPHKEPKKKRKLVQGQIFHTPYSNSLRTSPYKGIPTETIKQSPKLYSSSRLIIQNPYARQKLKLNIIEMLGDYYPITSKYGLRKDPVKKGKLKTYSHHNGIDIGTPIGTPIYSPADAVVSKIHHKSCSGGGKKIYLDHYKGYQTIYMHLSTIIIQEGQYINKGQLIGYTGMSGFRVTGPHLHLEVKKDGIHLNPHCFLEN